MSSETEVMECQTIISWQQKKKLAKLEVTIPNLKRMAEFQSPTGSSKSFYFSSDSVSPAKKDSGEWRLDINFNGTSSWLASVHRNSYPYVQITGGGLKVTLPSETLEAPCTQTTTGSGKVCALDQTWRTIPTEEFIITFSVEIEYLQPDEDHEVSVACKPPLKLEQRLWTLASAAYEDLFLKGSDSDVTFVIGKEEIPAHKVILAARVPYFANMMSSGMVEAQTKEIKIDDSDAESFTRMLRYVYCAQLPDDLEYFAFKLLPLADKYDLPELKEACVYAMGKGLTKENACETLVAADLYRCDDLKKKCLKSLSQWRSAMEAELLKGLSDHPNLLVELLCMP